MNLQYKELHQFNTAQHFEVHVTIFPTEIIPPFADLCDSFPEYSRKFNEFDNEKFDNNASVISCKPIIIELPEGSYKQQPMCSTYVFGTLSQAIKYGELFSKYIEENGKDYNYKVSRNKVEARFRNVLANSITLDENLPHHKGKYWEFHIKVVFDLSEIKEKLENTSNTSNDTSNKNNNTNTPFNDMLHKFRKDLLSKYPNSRLSKSALSNYDKTNNNITTRIVTFRLYNGSKENAEFQLNNLLNYLKEISTKYIFKLRGDVEKELSVYDSNVEHDKGWIGMKEDKNINNANDKTNTEYKLLTLMIKVLLILLLLYFYNNNYNNTSFSNSSV